MSGEDLAKFSHTITRSDRLRARRVGAEYALAVGANPGQHYGLVYQILGRITSKRRMTTLTHNTLRVSGGSLRKDKTLNHLTPARIPCEALAPSRPIRSVNNLILL